MRVKVTKTCNMNEASSVVVSLLTQAQEELGALSNKKFNHTIIFDFFGFHFFVVGVWWACVYPRWGIGGLVHYQKPCCSRVLGPGACLGPHVADDLQLASVHVGRWRLDGPIAIRDMSCTPPDR